MWAPVGAGVVFTEEVIGDIRIIMDIIRHGIAIRTTITTIIIMLIQTIVLRTTIAMTDIHTITVQEIRGQTAAGIQVGIHLLSLRQETAVRLANVMNQDMVHRQEQRTDIRQEMPEERQLLREQFLPEKLREETA